MVSLANVQYGQTNDDIRVVQEALIAEGISLLGGADGWYGDQTKAAYATFEQSIGYTPPGGSTTPNVKLSDVQYGDDNSSVTRVQNALIAEGFSIPAGATGYFGDQTLAAYSQFQQSLGYSGSAANGHPGCTSLTELGSRRGFSVSCDVADGGTGTANSPTAGAISESSVSFYYSTNTSNTETEFVKWANKACDYTGVPRTWVTGVSNGANLRTLAVRESSYNERAVNGWDSNAWGPIQVDGYPKNSSRGYCQTIPPTFASYHEEGLPNGIYYHASNIAAAINYIRARYGDISNVQQANPNMSPRGY